MIEGEKHLGIIFKVLNATSVYVCMVTMYVCTEKNDLLLHCQILVKMTRKWLILHCQRVDKFLTKHLSNFSQKLVSFLLEVCQN